MALLDELESAIGELASLNAELDHSKQGRLMLEGTVKQLQVDNATLRGESVLLQEKGATAERSNTESSTEIKVLKVQLDSKNQELSAALSSFLELNYLMKKEREHYRRKRTILKKN